MNKSMLLAGIPDLPMRAFQPVGGRMRLFKSDAPDNRGMNEAALKSAEISKEALDWFKDYVAKTEPDRQAAAQRSNAISDAQLEAMNFATQQAKEMDQRNKTVFQPLEDQIVADAETFDTAARRSQASAEARSDVEQAYGSAQEGLNRNLLRMGVTPGSGRSMALMQTASLDKAKALAGATTGAVKNIEAQGYARKMDAVGLGKGIVGNQATQQQIATQTGNSSAANANGALSAATSAGGLMQTGFSQALQGMGQAGSLYGQAAQIKNQANAADAAAMSGLGSLVGQVGAAYFLGSDENIKSDTDKPADTAAMLEQVEGLPVKKGWKYDPAKGGPDDGGVEHDGPMAQQVLKRMGPDVAPGGKVIDMVSMNGRLIGAVQELSKQQKQTNQRLKRMEGKVAA